MPAGTGRSRAVAEYLAELLRELSLWGERLGSAPVETIFFGGGTPSSLPERAVAGILDRARKVFAVAADAEITVEANPESALAPGWLTGVRKAGVNRLSLGVQSMDDAELALLGRTHTAQHVLHTVEAARAAKFSNVSLDLMWGLPGLKETKDHGEIRPQRLQQWLRRLEVAISLEPEHISAYGLTIEPGTPLFQMHDEGVVILPEEKEQSAMFLHGAEYLESQGYMQYEISNFARLGFECRHNLGYWDGADYLGIGPAAVSTINGVRWANPADVRLWQDAVRDERVGQGPFAAESSSPTKKHTAAPAEDQGAVERQGYVETLDTGARLKELVMLRLRTTQGLSMAQWEEKSGRSFHSVFGALAQLLQKNGLAATRRGYFRLTRAGMLVSNTIVEHFFTALEG